MGVEFWFCLGGSYLLTLKGSGGMPSRKIIKIMGFEITFTKNMVKYFIFSKQHFIDAFCDKSDKHTNLMQHL